MSLELSPDLPSHPGSVLWTVLSGRQHLRGFPGAAPDLAPGQPETTSKQGSFHTCPLAEDPFL